MNSSKTPSLTLIVILTLTVNFMLNIELNDLLFYNHIEQYLNIRHIKAAVMSELFSGLQKLIK